MIEPFAGMWLHKDWKSIWKGTHSERRTERTNERTSNNNSKRNMVNAGLSSLQHRPAHRTAKRSTQRKLCETQKPSNYAIAWRIEHCASGKCTARGIRMKWISNQGIEGFGIRHWIRTVQEIVSIEAPMNFRLYWWDQYVPPTTIGTSVDSSAST